MFVYLLGGCPVLAQSGHWDGGEECLSPLREVNKFQEWQLPTSRAASPRRISQIAATNGLLAPQ
jgi:hypothetical protein